ncbi:MAG: MBL fold metallo-hydrolase [Thermodesulfobacteriota bacterium]
MKSDPSFAHPFCFPELKAALERTREKEILPDVWLLEGNLGLSFFLAPPSSNIYLLRDRDLVVLLDTGLHPYYRPKILNVLERWRRDGARTLVLLVSQGHWDHALNNEVVLAAGYDQVRFLLPEPEVPVIESMHHWLADLTKLETFFDPYPQWTELLTQFEQYARTRAGYTEPEYAEVWTAIKGMAERPDRKAFRSAIKLLGERILFRRFRSLAEQAEILPLSGRERRRFGDVEVLGWSVGRFFIIHDASHSPGHLCLYDPKNKLIISGDVTIEINPAFFDTSMERLTQASGNLRRMAEQGFIEIAADAHRNPTAFQELVGFLGIDPLHPTELSDVCRGREECAAFFRIFEDYYREMRDETLAAWERLGQASLPEILAELAKSPSRFVKFKLALPFPSRPEVLVARILDENGYIRRSVDDRLVFSPPEKWRY